MVPPAGLEPARSFDLQILSLLRIPISPRGHLGGINISSRTDMSNPSELMRIAYAIFHKCGSPDCIHRQFFDRNSIVPTQLVNDLRHN